MAVDLINMSGLVRQASSAYQMDQKTGGFKGTVTWLAPWASALSLAPKKLDAHPDSPSLLCTDTKIMQEEGGLAKIESTYEGISPVDNEGGFQLPAPEYELNTSTTQEPIETLAAFKDMTAQERQEVDDAIAGSPSVDPDLFTAEQTTLYTFKSKGITSYFVPSVTYTKSYASFSRPSKDSLKNVGKIDKPSGAPDLRDGRTWLKLGVTYRQAGGYFQIQESWMASGDNGWDVDIYG